MIKLSDFVAKRLKEIYNVKKLFMISGGGAMHLNDSFGKFISYICNHNEQATSISAEGYARSSNGLGIVCVTTGPGGLNALNGLFGSFTDSASVLFISGQVKTRTCKDFCPDLNLRQLGDQEVDIISVVKPLCKYATRITEPQDIKYCLDKAIYEATTGRKGPVWLDIPIDIQASIIDENNLREFIPIKIQYQDFSKTIEKIKAKFKNSKKPLIIAGHGIKLSGQEKILKEFLINSKIPCVSTFNGFDIFKYNDKFYFGNIGTIGQRGANFILQNADCILFLGTRNNIRQISYNWENFAKNAFKIIVDIDENEIKKPLIKPDLSLCADLKDFLPQLLHNSEIFSNEKWLEYCKKMKEKYSFLNINEYKQTKKIINPYFFTYKLIKNLNPADKIVSANATPSICLFQASELTGQKVIMNSGNASMGYDLPCAIGVSACNMKGNVICLAGDGSIMMNLQELQTIKYNKLPIKIFVFNNSGYISIKQTQSNFFDGRNTACSNLSGVSMPDFCQIANAFGIKTIRLENPTNIDATIKKDLAENAAILCDVILDKDYIFTPKLSSKKLPDGTMISPSLENMFPFLSDEELKSNIFNN